jgi:hypothetical protein
VLRWFFTDQRSVLKFRSIAGPTLIICWLTPSSRVRSLTRARGRSWTSSPTKSAAGTIAELGARRLSCASFPPPFLQHPLMPVTHRRSVRGRYTSAPRPPARRYRRRRASAPLEPSAFAARANLLDEIRKYGYVFSIEESKRRSATGRGDRRGASG